MTDLARSSGDSVQIGSIIAGRYKVDKLLGRGGFGAVYKVEHATTGKAQVLKVLKPNLADDPTQVQRFMNEAKVSSRLSHPNTVNVFDFGQTETGLLFLAMELLDGEELGHAMREKGTLEPVRTIHIAMAVLKSLAEAHAAGLVHRDLKPDNIFLCKHAGEADFVKVIDFGIAKPIDPGTDAGLTRTGFTVGTPKYMSPEQVLNKPLDGRSDLYALGVILYQCLAGDVPFAGPSPMETLMMHLQQEPRPLQEVAPQPLPPGLAAVVMQALRKNPWERFTDAEDMLDALEEVLIGAGRLMPTQKRAMSAKLRAVTPTELEGHTEAHPGPRGERAATSAPRPVTEPTRVSRPAPALVPPSQGIAQPVGKATDPLDARPLPEQSQTLALEPSPRLQAPTPQRGPWIAIASVAVGLLAVGLWWTLGRQAPAPIAQPAPVDHAVPQPLVPPPVVPQEVRAAAPVAVQAAVPVWLGEADVAQAVSRGLTAVHACRQGEAAGPTAVQVEVDAHGTVTQAKVAAPAADLPSAGCVAAAVRSLPFGAGSAPRAGILVFPAAPSVPDKAVATEPRVLEAPGTAAKKVHHAHSEKRAGSANGDEAL